MSDITASVLTILSMLVLILSVAAITIYWERKTLAQHIAVISVIIVAYISFNGFVLYQWSTMAASREENETQRQNEFRKGCVNNIKGLYGDVVLTPVELEILRYGAAYSGIFVTKNKVIICKSGRGAGEFEITPQRFTDVILGKVQRD